MGDKKCVYKISNLVKNGKKIEHMRWQFKYINTVDCSTKYFVAPQKCKEKTYLHCHDSTQESCIVDSYVQANSYV
jgi:hypothetical protein